MITVRANRFVCAVLTLALSLSCSAAQAYRLINSPFAEQVEKADAVVIAVAITTSPGPANLQPGPSPENSFFKKSYTRFVVSSQLKGALPETVEVLTGIGISEWDPDCCQPGKSYLLVLNYTPRGDLQLMYGRNSFWPVDGGTPAK